MKSPALTPDLATCPECMRELFDPASRRFRYPFIACNQCGPSFSVLAGPGPDGEEPGLEGFAKCPACQAEYDDPQGRRYCLASLACPQCGPTLWLETVHLEGHRRRGQRPSTKEAGGDAAVLKAQRMLAQGRVVAIVDTGAYYLACDATDPGAVAELRLRLGRPDQPLPVMVAGWEMAEELCKLDILERELLESPARPLVITRKRSESAAARQAAPHLDTLHLALPFNALHHLLFSQAPKGRFTFGQRVNPPKALVMASTGLIAKQPVADGGDDRHRLAGLADAVLAHDLPIQAQVDRSLARVYPDAGQDGRGGRSTAYLVRRSRGYAPAPVELPLALPAVLAAGSDRANTFCLARGRRATLSPHNGNLRQPETFQAFEGCIARMEGLLGIRPEILAHDLDREWLATRYALERGEREKIPAAGVQAHHAHIVACMAENGLPPGQPVIGVAFDGGGLGEDKIDGKTVSWGGEFLLTDYLGYRRPYHLAYLPLPGGEEAGYVIARTALGYLWEAGLEWEIDIPSVAAVCAQDISLLRSMLKHRLNTPLTSSMGRLFEAVASLSGLRQETSYPGQAAMELEAAADPEEETAYPFEVRQVGDGAGEIDPIPVIRSVVDDARAGVRLGAISARFHNGMAQMVYLVCKQIAVESGITGVALSGAVWQNALLLEKSVRLLEQGGFRVYYHQQAPADDGGLSLGQALVAGARLAG